MANARTPPTSLGATFSQAAGVLASQAGTLLPIMIAWALLYTIVEHQIYEMVKPETWPPSQEDLLPMAGATMLGLWVMEIVLGPFLAAVTIYATRNHLQGKSGSAYGAVNFGLTRYSRMVLPHALSFTLVNVGMVIVVPGILYMMQYAFVDSVAALESKKTWAMGRSKKLTRSRRKRIFMVFLPFLIYGQIGGLAAIMVQEQPALLFAIWLLQIVLTVFMFAGFHLIYAERTTPRDEAAPAPAKDGELKQKA